MTRTLEQLDAAVAKIEAFIGDMDIRHAADVAGNYNNRKELPNGDYPLAQNIHQLREAVNIYAAKLAAAEANLGQLESPAPAISALSSKVTSLETRVKAVEARPPGSVQAPPSNGILTPTIPLPDGSTPTIRELILRAGAVAHTFINSENDGGLGICFNFAIPGWRPGSSHTNPRMAQIIERFEQDGVWSLKYAKPNLVPNPNIAEELTPGDYDGLPGKSFVVKPGGQALSGRADRDVIVGTGEPGRGMTFGVVPKGGSPNSPIPLMRFGEDGVFIYNADRSERKL